MLAARTALCFAFTLMSCATVINGRTQNVSVSSTPPGASVFIDGAASGLTPTVVELTRNDTHTVRIEKAGYLLYLGTITPTASGWMFGNAPLPVVGLVGIFYDLHSGGAYNLTPDQLSPTLLAAPAPAPPAPAAK